MGAELDSRIGFYNKLHQEWKGINERSDVDEIFDLTLTFATEVLGYQRCLIFVHEDETGLFKVHAQRGYDDPKAQMMLRIVNLLLSGEIIEHLRLSGEYLIHTQAAPNPLVDKLLNSLSMKEAVLELFGGDVEAPYGLIITGNAEEPFASPVDDLPRQIALNNLVFYLSNSINNTIFYAAWERERQTLKENIDIRTRELREQKESFEAIYTTSKDGIAVLDIHTTAFLDANPAYQEMTGFTKDELLRTSCLVLTVESDRERSRVAMEEVKEKGFVKDFIKTCLGKDDRRVIVSMSMALMSDRERVLVSSRDITSTVQLQSELLEAKEKAEYATKAKSEFLANMSHEIRTPMNGIIGMCHLVLQTELSNKQRNYVNKIDTSAKSLLGIINDILDFSKIEAGKLTIDKIDFDLFKVVDSVVNLIELKAHEKNLEIIVGYGTEVGKHVRGDSLRVAQILTNLLNNAVKFTQEGEVGIYVSKIGPDRFRFEVRDTGIGLSPDQVARLFQSFSQADASTTRKFGGTGLGLAICKQLVELMNGRIWVESEEGVGSSFIFEIELEVREEPEKRYNSFAEKRVLVVDDNETWREILVNLLQMFGIRADVSGDGDEAITRINHCNDCSQGYDLILMDWNMPRRDGIETTRMIHERCCLKKPPTVIMVSAFRQESIVNLAREAGIEFFLQKPINPSMLNDILSGVFLDDIANRHVLEETESLKDNLSSLAGSRILLVEDNPINQEIVLGFLEGSGIQIDVAADGKQGVEMYRDGDHEMILMDVQMPIMDGYEATRLIRMTDERVPIVALTANAMKEDVEKTLSIGMNEHLNKPIDVERLYEVLLKYVEPRGTDAAASKLVEPDQSSELVGLGGLAVIDSSAGLAHMAGNRKLYLRILRDFYKNYEGRRFALDDPEFGRVIHTLKGLSANIGAGALHRVAEALETDPNEDLLATLHDELAVVLDELVQCGLTEVGEGEGPRQGAIDAEAVDGLMTDLCGYAAKRSSQGCKGVLESLSAYQLPEDAAGKIKQIPDLLGKRDYKGVIELLGCESG